MKQRDLQQNKLKTFSKLVVNLLVVALVIGFLLYFQFIDLRVLGRILDRPPVLILALGMIFASYVSGTLRWLQILKAQGFNIGFFRLFNIYTASIFSAIFLPGGTGSWDAIRAMLILKAAPDARGRAILTVVLDRFCEVLALSLMAATLGLLSPREPSAPIYWLRIAALALPFLLLGGAFFAYVLTVYLRNSAWAQRFEGRLIWQPVSAASGFIELIVLNPKRVLSALFFAGVTRALTIGTVVVIAVASDAPQLSLADFGQAAAFSMFANGIPITPGGIGVGEAVFNQICSWLANPPINYPYATIFLASRVLSMVTACYGLIPLVSIGQSLYDRRR